MSHRNDDRRASDRLPIERPVRYKVLGEKKVMQVGWGKTLNMSGGGVLFTTESALSQGQLVELAVSWPAKLSDMIPLNLVLVGRVVHAKETQAAISIESYEFKTRGSSGV